MHPVTASAKPMPENCRIEPDRKVGRGGLSTPRPLRIAYCISRTFEAYQGTYGRYCGQARLLRDLGHDVTVLAVNRNLDLPANEDHFGVSVRRIPIRALSWAGLRNTLNFRRIHVALLRELREGKFDAVKVIGLDLCPMIPAIKRKLGVPVIFDMHEPMQYSFWKWPRRMALPLLYGIERHMSRRADAVHITGNWQKRKYEAWGCRDVTIVGNQPLWDERIDKWPEGKFDAVKAGGPILFGRLGTVYHGTGLDELLRAFAIVYQRFPDRARLKMAGKVAEYYEDEFENTIEPYREGIILSGTYKTTDMPDLYGEIHVSVLPYLRDANFSYINPSKFYDSIGNATAVVMTPIGDMGEIVPRLRCGRLIDPQRLETIVEAMSHYLNHPEDVEADARRGFEASLGEFSWKANQRQLEETFQRITR